MFVDRGADSPTRRLFAMVDRYPVYRLVQKLQALAWSEIPVAGHALADLEAQVDLLLQLGPQPRHDPPTAPAPPMMDDQWPREF
jgi:hypothetical protein